MKNFVCVLLLALAAGIPSYAMTHQTCVVVTGSPVQQEILDVLLAKGYRPLIDDTVAEGDLYLNGDANCGRETRWFVWQVCVAEINIYLKASNERKVLLASAEAREENSFEFTSEYPRLEAKLSAIRKLPNCSIGRR